MDAMPVAVATPTKQDVPTQDVIDEENPYLDEEESKYLYETLGLPLTPPTHKDLPDSDGTFVKNHQEHPQSILITESIWPILEQRHPDRNFAIGQDSGIYWRVPRPSERKVRSAVAPDWFYVPDVPPTLDGEIRRSYVMWQEIIAPLLVLEFVSGDGSEERDRTPNTGKFWIYENAIRPTFYGIYEVQKGSIELYHLVDREYQLVSANERNHYPIDLLGIELGIWKERYQNAVLPWLRIWDSDGNLLLIDAERAEKEAQRADQEAQRADQEAQRAEKLAERLRALGVDPDEL